MDFLQKPGMCWPTIIAGLMAVSSVYNIYRSPANDDVAKVNKKRQLVNNLIFGVIFTTVIYQLCKTGHNTAAWIVLFLPVILISLLVFFAYEAIVNAVGHLPTQPVPNAGTGVQHPQVPTPANPANPANPPNPTNQVPAVSISTTTSVK